MVSLCAAPPTLCPPVTAFRPPFLFILLETSPNGNDDVQVPYSLLEVQLRCHRGPPAAWKSGPKTQSQERLLGHGAEVRSQVNTWGLSCAYVSLYQLNYTHRACGVCCCTLVSAS